MLSPTTLRFGPFELRPVERQLRRDGRPVNVGARAFDLLLALVAERGRLVTKEQLLDRAWPGLVVEEANVQVQVSALRKALGAQAIATVPGLGYRFAMALDDEPAASVAAPEVEYAGAARGQVPLALDALIGREADLRLLDTIAAQSRLISLVGPGGIGKTRLAQAWAHSRRDAHAHGAWWIELAAIAASERIAPAVAAAMRLGLSEADDEAEAVEAIARALAARDCLLVLDNCEHLAAGVARLVHALLAAGPAVRVLATSREPLQLPGEQVLRLGPLAVPADGASLDEARRHGAIRLLEERARAIDRRFSLAADNLGAAIALVRRLDGHPLAIEMAAARLPALGAAVLAARLEERLSSLRSAARDAPPRHQTLRATLDWSHALLDPQEQQVLRRLAVCRGSFDLARALRIVADEALEEDAAIEALSELVDKSLVRLERLDPPRYRLSEMTRLYAAEKLDAAGETVLAEQRHGIAMAERAEEALRAFWTWPDRRWIPEAAADAEDIEAAADRALATRDAAVAAPTLELLIRLDMQRGVDATLPRRMRAALQLLPFAQGALRARLLQCVAPHSPIVLAEPPRLDAAREAVLAWRPLGDRARLYESLLTLAYELALVQRFDEADEALAEAGALEDPAWGPRLRQLWPSRAGCIAGFRGDAAGYRRHSERAWALAREAEDTRGALVQRSRLMDAALMSGDAAAAIDEGLRLAADVQEAEAPALLATTLLNLCAAQLRVDDIEGACASASRALPLAWLHGQAGFLLDHVALIAARRGRHAAAAQLLGYVDAWYAAEHHERETNEAASVQEATALARAALGEAVFAGECEAGARLREDEARALAQRALV